MPFSEDMNDVFEDLIKVPLEEAGYDVQRADDISSSANIISDIVQSIESAHLIVADLTHQNQNVYYEVGLSHARSRPTILLTQNLEEVPFDLRSYRIIEYGIDYKSADQMKTKLQNMASKALIGETKFGSPISDFLHIPIETPYQTSVVPKGFLDIMADFEDATEDNLKSINEMTDAMGELTDDTRDATSRLNEVSQGKLKRPFSEARQVSRSFAGTIHRVSNRIEAAGGNSDETLQRMQDGLDHITSTYSGKTELTSEELEAAFVLYNAIIGARDSTSGATSQFDELLKTFKTLRGNEQSLNAAITRFGQVGHAYNKNAKQFTAIYSRASDVLINVLREHGDDDDLRVRGIDQ